MRTSLGLILAFALAAPAVPALAADAATTIDQSTGGCSACLAVSQSLAAALDGAAGVTSLDQADAGAAVQSSIAHLDLPPPGSSSTAPGAASASTSASQVSDGVSVTASSASASLTDSGNGNGPVLMLNQAAGVGAEQLNALALAQANGSGGLAMADAELSQVSHAASISLPASAAGATTTATIANALNGNTGFVAVNQSSGSGNQANLISVATVGASALHF